MSLPKKVKFIEGINMLGECNEYLLTPDEVIVTFEGDEESLARKAMAFIVENKCKSVEFRRNSNNVEFLVDDHEAYPDCDESFCIYSMSMTVHWTGGVTLNVWDKHSATWLEIEAGVLNEEGQLNICNRHEVIEA